MEENVYYVYLHRRASDNKVFYVGKGKGYRANSKTGRNKKWLNTVKKHGYFVEIVFDNLTEEEAYDLEIQTILEIKYLFGERELCNISKGGHGPSGTKWPEDRRLSAMDNKIYSFVNVDGSTDSLTRHQFADKYGFSIQTVSHLFKNSSPCNSLKGWTVQLEHESVEEAIHRILEVQSRTNRDLTVYRFINRLSKETFEGTRKEACDLLGVSGVRLGALFCGSKTVNDWGVCLHGESDSEAIRRIGMGQEDHFIYTFEHLDGTEFIGTRREFFNKYNFRPNHLFCKNPKNIVKGWKLKWRNNE